MANLNQGTLELLKHDKAKSQLKVIKSFIERRIDELGKLSDRHVMEFATAAFYCYRELGEANPHSRASDFVDDVIASHKRIYPRTKR